MARILVLGGVPEDHDELNFALTNAGHETLYSDAQTAGRTIDTWAPQAIIFDIAEPGVSSAEAITRLQFQTGPGLRTPIIILTPDNSVDERISAIKAGAEECLGKPYSEAELMARLKVLLARYLSVGPVLAAPVATEDGAPVQGEVLSFYGSKGGVGTTTVAINTALSLRRLTGKRVALLDANFQFGDHRIFMDFAADGPSIDSLTDGPFDGEKIMKVMVSTDSGVDCLLAPRSPESADLLTADHVGYIIEQLRANYDYVVVDLDQHLDDRCLRAFDTSDMIFLVMTAELAGIKNSRLILDTLERIEIPMSSVKLLLNRATAFTGISNVDAATALRRPIDYKITNEYRGAVSALNSGHPTANASPESILGRDIDAFVNSAILGVSFDPKPAKAKKGLFGRNR